MKPGEIGLADVSYMRNGYSVCRIVKPNKLGGMWQLEIWERGWSDVGFEWSKPCRRKVNAWIPLGNADPRETHEFVGARLQQMFADQRALEKQYHAEIRALARGTSA